jgi:hypothetical protein
MMTIKQRRHSSATYSSDLYARSKNCEKRLLASSCLSVVSPTGRTRLTWTDFHEISYLSIFRKSVAKIQVSLKSDKNALNEDQCTFMIISRSVIFGMKNISDKSFRESRNTHFMFSYFFFVNHAIYEIIWNCTVEQGRPQMTIWRMRMACWITKVTNTHTEYVILIAFPQQQYLHERSSLLRYTYVYFARLVLLVISFRILCGVGLPNAIFPTWSEIRAALFHYIEKRRLTLRESHKGG